TEHPARAISIPAARPFGPDPTTTASNSIGVLYTRRQLLRLPLQLRQRLARRGESSELPAPATALPVKAAVSPKIAGQRVLIVCFSDACRRARDYDDGVTGHTRIWPIRFPGRCRGGLLTADISKLLACRRSLTGTKVQFSMAAQMLKFLRIDYGEKQPAAAVA